LQKVGLAWFEMCHVCVSVIVASNALRKAEMKWGICSYKTLTLSPRTSDAIELGLLNEASLCDESVSRREGLLLAIVAKTTEPEEHSSER
jgi:hypothetical protein